MTPPPLRIKSLRVDDHVDGVEISVEVDTFRLWYTVPGSWPAVVRPDAFAVAGLLPAMATGRDLELADDLPITPALLERLEQLQGIFLSWGSSLGVPFRRVAIHAATAEPPPPVPGTGSFFSGGIDGTYTFLKHAPEITQAIFLKGIDMQVTNDALYREALEVNSRFVEAHGARVLPVSTNIRFLGHHFDLSWNVYLGAGLASVANAVGLERVFLAAGHTWRELRPNGTHPLTDALWSGGSTTIIRDGEEALRTDKLAAIAATPDALDMLRVCWQDKGYNCGTCPKCLRTMIALELLHLKAKRFPAFPGVAVIRKLRIDNESELEFSMDMHKVALDRGRHDLATALARPIHRYYVRRSFRELDQHLFGGRIRKLLVRFR